MKIFSLIILISILGLSFASDKSLPEEYNPEIKSENFISEINNPYLNLTVGKKWIYEGTDEDENERIEIEVTNQEKFVMGIKMTVVRDRVWVDGELEEDTFDWFAQDKDGNVWYFGEWVDNYENGKIINHSGSWEAGVKGAKPGIIMKANPKVGDSYRQEFLSGEAEDMGEVLSLNQQIKTRVGNYTDCLQVKDWSPLEPKVSEYKFYSKEVGNLVLERKVTGEEGYIELVQVVNP
ncbi:MAG: hypothetical protein DWQ06_10805 [Calditrichaeota bacterium]|nr:MAG: hypothetical protein DWQ06_10805 [Calditrichota bacterium]